MNDFQKLSDCIAYYQTYHLTKHKYQWRANALKYFDCFPLDQLRRFHVKQYFALRSVESPMRLSIEKFLLLELLLTELIQTLS